MNKKNPSVDGFIRKHKIWQAELEALRTIALDCPLIEEMKWRIPCYTFEGKNIVLISVLKEYCALSFVKGSLLKDSEGILAKPGENTQSGRLIRFTTASEISTIETTLKAYILEAIEIEKSGLEVEYKKLTDYPIPDEFRAKLDADPEYKAAFEALTPGRQKGYLLHFAAAKQSKTREARIEKYRQRILDGVGLNDY
jgi:uncharacterized protein YdeI (YjbR/CyaY-like superfamily)